MKVLLVASSQIPIPPEKGGAVEKLLFGLYSNLKHHMDIRIVSCCKKGDYEYAIVPSLKLPNPWSMIYEFFWGVKVSLMLRKEKPDVVHLNIPFNSAPIMLLKFLYPSTKIIYTSHNPSWTVPDSELGIFNRIIEKLEEWVMRRADKIVAVSQAMKRGFVEKAGIPEEKISVIYNFVDTRRFNPKHGDSWKKVRGIKKMVLFVGKLTELKGVPNLIRAIPKVLEKHPEAVFVFVGGTYYGRSDNPYINMVKELGVEENVIFTGPVSEEELVRIFSSADVFVLPTKREGLPLVILEALASGTPVVATNVSGIPEVVDEKVGRLLEKGTPEEISEHIIFANNNIDRRKCRERAGMFSLEKISGEWRKAYEKLCQPD